MVGLIINHPGFAFAQPGGVEKVKVRIIPFIFVLVVISLLFPMSLKV